MTKLKWRLSKLPTPQEVIELVNNKLITQKEAKDILFGEVDERDEKSLKEEIEFLRGLVEKLSNNSGTKVIEIIQERNYTQPWYQPYYNWSHSNENMLFYSGTPDKNGNTLTVTDGSGATNFSGIETY